MSHSHAIICPNCGFHATENYCARCGQETHLHKDTFFGLVFHFIGHYFHYDSKFWKTLKALLFKPGKLTVAYWAKQRMRYIPPVSLYIFVSALFFLLFFLTTASHKKLYDSAKEQLAHMKSNEQRIKDSVKEVEIQQKMAKLGFKTSINDSAIAERQKYYKNKVQQVFDSPEKQAHFFEEMFHTIPKVLFFMIPFTAFILWLLFIRRNENPFVHHAIFSLHIHSFVFVLFLFALVPVPNQNGSFIQNVIQFVQNIIPFVIVAYLAVAIRNAYQKGWGRAILYSFVISLSYAFVFIIFMGIYFAREFAF